MRSSRRLTRSVPVRTYADLFAVREFRNLFLANCAGIAAHTTSALALGALTYASTGSALLTALSMFGAPLAGVLGSLTLLSAADSVPPRRALTLAAVLVAAGAALQAVPGLPLWARFAVLFTGAYVGSITAGARWALLTDILPSRRLRAGQVHHEHERRGDADRRVRTGRRPVGLADPVRGVPARGGAAGGGSGGRVVRAVSSARPGPPPGRRSGARSG